MKSDNYVCLSKNFDACRKRVVEKIEKLESFVLEGSCLYIVDRLVGNFFPT